jgi:hypothetical protein
MARVRAGRGDRGAVPAWIGRFRIPLALAAGLAVAAALVPFSQDRPLALPAAEDCRDAGRTTVQTPRGSFTTRFSPEADDDTTFDASLSSWRPDLSTYPINLDSGAARTCWLGGAVYGSIPESMTWEDAHDLNQPCFRIVPMEWLVVDGLRCDNTDDGIRPRETETGADDVTMLIRGTYLSEIRDDCLENDGIIGGLLQDNLWDGCNTGISERPSEEQGSFDQPPDETLVLDRMLIGLRIFPHEEGPGENALFKWSDSANQVVIRCSLFKVDAMSLNGPDAMAIPGTVDDRRCPDRPTTLVWLGEGSYPGRLPTGITVTSDASVWDAAVADWRCRHGYATTGCRRSTASVSPSPSASSSG